MEHDRDRITAAARWTSQRGASAVEYVLLAAGILAVAVAVLLLLSAHLHRLR